MALIHVICPKEHFGPIEKVASKFGEVTHYEEPPEDTTEAYIIAHVSHAGETGADVWFVWEGEQTDSDVPYLRLPEEMDRLEEVLRGLVEKGDALVLSPALLGNEAGEFTVSEDPSADPTVAMRGSEELTSPGFKFVPADEEEQSPPPPDEMSPARDGEVATEGSLPDPTGSLADPARDLWRLHREGFDGYVEVVSGPIPTRIWWRGGFPVALEGAGHLLVRQLMLMGERHVNTFLLERSQDPVAAAIRAGHISKEEEQRWRFILVLEVFTELASMPTLPVPVPEPSYSIPTTWQVDMEPLLLRAVVEGYDPARSVALMGEAHFTSIVRERWERLRFDPRIDPLWIQAVGLVMAGVEWKEACIRAGLSEREGANLLYGLRLLGIAEPQLPEYPTHEEMIRRRVEGLLERARRFPAEELLDGRGAVARRRYQDIMVMLSEIPPHLALMMHEKLTLLRRLLDEALEKVT